MALFSIHEVSRTRRDEPPTHFTLRIESFSLLSNSSLERYDSGSFQVGQYKWRLCMYPKGNKGKNGEGHISLYLEILQTDSLSLGWEVHVLFRILVLDQLRDNYLVVQDAYGRARRFRATKTQYGLDRLMTLIEFNDPTKGYLLNDTCVFGVEVFVHKESVLGKGECLLMTAGPVTCNTWKIEMFSGFINEIYYSEVFTAGSNKWRVMLYPKGYDEEKGKSLSLFLELIDSNTLLPSQGLYAEAQLRVVDKLNGKHAVKKLQHWFSDSSKTWGWAAFLPLSSLRDASKGFLMKDACIIETNILFVGAIKKLGQKSE